jgi:5-methylcytosine-specific restriction protein A
MNTYIFIWNPKVFDWHDLEDSIDRVDYSGKTEETWGCGNTKSIMPGDRAFLVKLGTQPKGIIASGYIESAPFLTKHFKRGKKVMNCVNIEFEVLLNPEKDPILSIDILNTGKLSKQYTWTPQASGIKINPEITEELEAVWFDFLATQKIRYNPFIVDKTPVAFIEGTPYQLTLSRYERNPFARKVCLDHYGFACSVCDFNFQNVYGDLGREFIHVHHLTQVAKVGKKYQVDPIKDLRPICPNCHAMVHRQKEAISLEELKKLILKKKRGR